MCGLVLHVQWVSDFSNLQGKQKLVQEIGSLRYFGKITEKQIQGKQLLVGEILLEDLRNRGFEKFSVVLDTVIQTSASAAKSSDSCPAPRREFRIFSFSFSHSFSIQDH